MKLATVIGIVSAVLLVNAIAASPASARCVKTLNFTGYSMKRNANTRACEETLTFSFWEFFEIDLFHGGKSLGLGKECAKAAKAKMGRYNEGCTTEVGEGKGEFEEVASEPEAYVLSTESLPDTFTAKTGASRLETVGGLALTGTGGSASGEFSNHTEGKVSLEFTGVKDGEVSCRTAGAAVGVVSVPEAKLQTVDVLNAEKETLWGVAITLPATVEITCGVVKVSVKGSVLGSISSPSEGTETRFEFEQSKGKQKYASCNAPAKLCEKAVGLEAKIGATFETAGLTDSQEVKFAKMIQFFI
jgi:hypothetical protein